MSQLTNERPRSFDLGTASDGARSDPIPAKTCYMEYPSPSIHCQHAFK